MNILFVPHCTASSPQPCIVTILVIAPITFQFSAYFSLVGRKELTDAMINDLSKRITSESDLRDLATKGLKVPEYITDTQLHDNRHAINLAAVHVLKQWKKKNLDPYKAYDALCLALIAAEMPALIYDVL